MKTYYQILQEQSALKAQDVTDDEIMDFEEELPSHRSYSKKQIAATLQAIKDGAYDFDSAVEWFSAGKRDVPPEVLDYFDTKEDEKRKAQYKRDSDKFDKEMERERKRNAPKKPSMTEKKWKTFMKDVVSDTTGDLKNDIEDFDFQNYAPDIAFSLWHDPEVRDYVNWYLYNWNGRLPNKEQAIDFIADELYSYAP